MVTLGLLNRPRTDSALVRSVSSVTFAIGPERAFERAVEVAAGWMREINPAIPEDASRGAIIEIGGGGEHPARTIILEEADTKIWSATIDNPDRTVLGRTWVTEITVASRAQEVHFGTRLLSVTRRADDPYVPSIPRVVRNIIRALPCAADGLSLSEKPRYVESRYELEELLELLESPERRLPVVVMAQSVTRPAYTNLETLAQRVAGAAHVFGVTQEQTWHLTRRAGKTLSVFDGAVRLYYPKIKFSNADPFGHPLWLIPTGRIVSSSGAPIIARILSSGVNKGTTDYPRFAAVRRAYNEQIIATRRQDTSDADLRVLYEDENASLRQQLIGLQDEQNQWLADAEEHRVAAEKQISELKAQLIYYRDQNDKLRNTLDESGTTRLREPLTDYETFEDWAKRNLSARIWFAPKALKEIESSGQYREPSEIGEVLYLMDDALVSLRREPSVQKREDWQQGLTKLGVTLSACFARPGDMHRFPEYSVMYQGNRFWCNEHIKCGGGTDPRSMFRIYFHWHADEDLLIVGHLPTHLDNNLTN